MLLVYLMLSILASDAVAELYKWVDEDGHVTYSESIPPDKKGTSVDVGPPPSQQSINESNERLRKMQAENKDLQQSIGSNKNINEIEIPRDDAKVKRCVKVKQYIRTLEGFTPVYLDEYGDYHSQVSEHSYTYEGNRTYVNDKDRPLLINKLKQEDKSVCESIKNEVTKQEQYGAKVYFEERCKQAKSQLDEMKKINSHTTSDELNKFRKYVKFVCKGE